jgi:hypothetical protein
MFGSSSLDQAETRGDNVVDLAGPVRGSLQTFVNRFGSRGALRGTGFLGPALSGL